LSIASPVVVPSGSAMGPGVYQIPSPGPTGSGRISGGGLDLIGCGAVLPPHVEMDRGRVVDVGLGPDGVREGQIGRNPLDGRGGPGSPIARILGFIGLFRLLRAAAMGPARP